jgi:hypothetical protein
MGVMRTKYNELTLELQRLSKQDEQLRTLSYTSGTTISGLQKKMDALLVKLYVDGDDSVRDEIIDLGHEMQIVRLSRDRASSIEQGLRNKMTQAQATMDQIYELAVQEDNYEAGLKTNWNTAVNKLKRATQHSVDKIAEDLRDLAEKRQMFDEAEKIIAKTMERIEKEE